MSEAQQLVIFELVIIAVGASGWMIMREIKEYLLFRKWNKEQEVLRNPPSVLNQRLKEKQEIIQGLLKKIHSLETEVQRLGKRCVLLANEARYEPNALTVPLDRVPNPGRWAHLKKPWDQ
jgi:hypothetical protein